LVIKDREQAGHFNIRMLAQYMQRPCTILADAPRKQNPFSLSSFPQNGGLVKAGQLKSDQAWQIDSLREVLAVDVGEHRPRSPNQGSQ
jgi:hypothetical protein